MPRPRRRGRRAKPPMAPRPAEAGPPSDWPHCRLTRSRRLWDRNLRSQLLRLLTGSEFLDFARRGFGHRAEHDLLGALEPRHALAAEGAALGFRVVGGV